MSDEETQEIREAEDTSESESNKTEGNEQISPEQSVNSNEEGNIPEDISAVEDAEDNVQAEIDELVQDSGSGDGKENTQNNESVAGVDEASKMELENISDEQAATGNSEENEDAIELLKDVELNVKIELGRAKMYVEDVLKLTEGSVVELDKLAGDPVDIYVNERLVARGEVLVLNENFCVRVNQIVREVV